MAVVNLLLIAPDEVGPDNVVRLSGRRASHLTTVLRVTPGQRIRVGVFGKGRGTATVLTVSDDEVSLKVSTGAVGFGWDIDVVVAIPRPKAIPRLLFALASLGVRRVDLVNAWKVDKSYLSSPKLSEAAMLEELWLGCEQGAQARLPVLGVHRFFAGFAHQTLRQRMRDGNALRFVCHPEGGLWLDEAWHHARSSHSLLQPELESAGTSAPLCVAIGPEGGWTEGELDTFAQLGFSRVRLVNGTLRVDTACVVAVAQLELLARSACADRESLDHVSVSSEKPLHAD